VRRLAALAIAASLLAGSCSLIGGDPVVVGAVYPLSGSQGVGGTDEYRGVLLAADLVNDDGGVGGRPIEVRSIDVESADAAPGAIDRLRADGVDIVLGSFGSTISAPAASRAAAGGMLFWETGAVGMLPPEAALGVTTFRVTSSGGSLGRSAIAFVADRLAGLLRRDAASLRYAVAFVDDVYGRSVADGAAAELAERGLDDVGDFGYDFRAVDMRRFARRIEAATPDVLFVSAYLDDGIALRKALVAERVPLLANIGTSSSYCMPDFARALGADAVGLFASDKPSAAVLDPSGLRPEAAAALERADAEYRRRWGESMSPHALAGFSGAWALFHDVLPSAATLTPEAVARSAREIDLPSGSLPNGSGLRFGTAGSTEAGDNVLAASVIWEWVARDTAAVVWPPAYATEPVRALSISPWVTP
jgi:branched-chain amino acid transport system substrate-binding protein